MQRLKTFDIPFFVITLILVLGGLFIFISASLGLLARDGISISHIIFNQIAFGVLLGGVAMYLVSRLDYGFWSKYSLHIFILALVLTLAVHIPSLGLSHGGATRWLSFEGLSFQPAEVLKIASVAVLATWYAAFRRKITNWRYGLLPLVGILAFNTVVLLLQPDTGTLLVVTGALAGMYFVAGAPIKHFGILALIAVIGFGTLALVQPYIADRVITFLNLASDPLGSGYQVEQSTIAIGSGGVTGRGFGQSVQKFAYLPEPVGDSVFAVFAEEWGFIGGVILLGLILAFVMRGMYISARAPNVFARLLAAGLVLLIGVQSFLNIGSMVRLVPLTGLPLIFVSQGGTALLFALISVGIVLNISKEKKSIN